MAIEAGYLFYDDANNQFPTSDLEVIEVQESDNEI